MGALSHRDQGLGQDLGVGVQPGAQPPRHDHHRQAGLLAVVHVQAGGKDDVRDAAPRVSRIGSASMPYLFQQPAGRSPRRGHRQADWGGSCRPWLALSSSVPAPQDELAHVARRSRTRLQYALRAPRTGSAGPSRPAFSWLPGRCDRSPMQQFFHFQHGRFLALQAQDSRSMTRCWSSSSEIGGAGQVDDFCRGSPGPFPGCRPRSCRSPPARGSAPRPAGSGCPGGLQGGRSPRPAGGRPSVQIAGCRTSGWSGSHPSRKGRIAIARSCRPAGLYIAVIELAFLWAMKVLQRLHLGQAQGRLHVGHAVVVAHLVVQELQLRRPWPGWTDAWRARPSPGGWRPACRRRRW